MVYYVRSIHERNGNGQIVGDTNWMAERMGGPYQILTADTKLSPVTWNDKLKTWELSPNDP
jgi:hypothetical protein